MENIVIKGARENNLKNIDLTLPKNKMIVMTGVSGSGNLPLHLIQSMQRVKEDM